MINLRTMRTWIGIMLLVTLLALPFLSPLKQYLSIPHTIMTMDQSSIQLPIFGKAIPMSTNEDQIEFIQDHTFYAHPGESEIIYEVSGVPIKKVDVSILEDVKIIPGGQSIGVQLNTLGVLVVGHHLVNAHDDPISPGEDANIEVGDMILKINDEDIQKMEDVKPFVEKAGNNNQSLELTVKRGEQTFTTSLKPVKDERDQEYRIGLYIRDSAAGIGTMSFYDPVSKKYGALGHVISDSDTKQPIEIYDGTVARSSVISIERGNHGSPGEKQAKFSVRDSKIGTIEKNSPFGIFGELEEPIRNNHYDQPMPIALSHEVKEGPAKILTVLEDEEVEVFDIEIVSSVTQKFPATKGMVIKVTDEKLLEKTGGIVQGMSGSPIIQDGKVIGAVTHVFVNDPTSGYGVHIEWMMQEAGIDIYHYEEGQQAS